MKKETKVQPDTEQEKIKAIVYECYTICKNKNIKIEASLSGNREILYKLKCQFKMFSFIDVNSELYKGILNITRKALNEIKEDCIGFNVGYLVEYFLTAPFENVIGKKSIKVEYFKCKKEVQPEGKIEIPKNTKKENFIPSDINGKKLTKLKNETSGMEDWELSEEEISDEEEEEFFDTDEIDMDDDF